MAAQAPRSVKFQEDQAEEISVVNTFVHVPDKEARMAWRQKTTRSAPGSMLNIEDDDSTEVYPAERDDREIPNEEEEDEDDDTFPIAMTHVKTYDSFDACFDLEEDVDEESGLDRAPSVQKVSTFDPFEVDKVPTNDPFEVDRAGSLSSGRLVANSALPGQTGPMPCRGQENPMPANAMMCVQAIPVQLVPAVIPAPAAMGQGLISVPAPATAPTPSSPSTSPRQPILLGRTGQTALPQGQVEVKMDAAASPLQCVTLPNGKELVRWSVDARKLESQEKQILSPEFELNLGQHGLKPFRVMILAKETKGKGGRGFVKAGGRGRLFIKCETSSLPADMCQVGFRAVIGHGTPAETSAGPLWHQFTEQPCCPLQGTRDDWDLLPVVDSIQKRFEVLIEVVGHSLR